MEFRIHYTINDIEDFYEIEGETIEEIREMAKKEDDKRGLEMNRNNMWSENFSS